MDGLHTRIASMLDAIPADFGGGCSLSKACFLADLIRDEDLKITLDIGVYRGRSLFPQAMAHKLHTKGTVYGVDPWSGVEAVQEQAPAHIQQKVKDWASSADLGAIYDGVSRAILDHDLAAHCVLVRQTSAAAIDYFTEHKTWFDLVHVDGNHDTARVEEDVALYLPRLRRGGFLVMDDVSWPSVRPVCDFVSSRMRRIYEDVEGTNDFAVFWNEPDWAARNALSARHVRWRTQVLVRRLKLARRRLRAGKKGASQ